MASVTISEKDIQLGHRVTFEGEQVEVPYELVTSGIVGLINIGSNPAINTKAIVMVMEDGITLVNGDELDGRRLISILEFVE